MQITSSSFVRASQQTAQFRPAILSLEHLRRLAKMVAIVIGVIPLATLPLCAQSSSPGNISDVVLNAKGVGLPATVQVTSLGSGKQFASVKSAANGSFSVSSLPVGWCQICATTSASGYVDSCLSGR